MRYSEKKGLKNGQEDDRITCAATQEVHNEAVDFMKGLDL
jgi:hypothetical protein